MKSNTQQVVNATHRGIPSQKSRGTKFRLLLLVLLAGLCLIPAGIWAADSSWKGTTSVNWSAAGNWTDAGGQPGATGIAIFDTNYTGANAPNVNQSISTAGGIWMVTGVPKNVVIISKNPAADILTIAGNLSINGNANCGLLVENASAFTFTLSSNTKLGNDQSWINNSANLMTISVQPVNANGKTLTVTGSGNTTISSAITNTGSLIKDGPATLTLSGASTYSGTTTVSNGTLTLSSAWLGSGAVSVSVGGTLGVVPAAQNATLGMDSLTFGSSGNTTNTFYLGGFTNSAAPIENVTNMLTLNGTVVVNVSGTALTAGSPIPLITWGSISGSGGFVVGSLPLGFSPTLTTLATNGTTLELTLSLISYNKLYWRGETNGVAFGDWVNTAPGVNTNWYDPLLPGPAGFNDFAPVHFDDTLTGTSTVNVPATVLPGAITLSNVNVNYTFGGAGNIGGGASLTKLGAGRVTMGLTNNSYSGNTLLSNGTFIVAAPNVIPDGASAQNVVVQGTLDLAGFNETINGLSGGGTITNSTGASILTVGNNNAAGTFSGLIKDGLGTMALTKAGSGTLTLSGNNNHSGGTTILEGTLQVGHTNALGTGLVTLNGGALSSDSATARTLANAVTITATTTLGHAVNNGALTLSGQVDLGGATRILTNPSPVILSGTLTNGGFDKLGADTLTFKGNAYVSANCRVSDGTLVLDGATVVSSATFEPNKVGSPGTARIVLTNGAQLTMQGVLAPGRNGAPNMTNLLDIAGLLTVTNPAVGIDFKAKDARNVANLLSNGVAQVGRIQVSGNNVNDSEFNFDGGTLRATANNAGFFSNYVGTAAYVRDGGAFIDSSNFNITIDQPLLNGGTGGLTKLGAGVLFLNGVNTYVGPTLVSAGTLGGGGTIAGPVTFVAGTTLAPGASIGTLTLNSNLTLNAGAAALFELNTSNSPATNDYLVVTGTQTITNSTLTVTNTGPELVVGDSFTLLSQPTSGFTTVNLPFGYTWTNKLAFDGSIQVLAVLATIPTNIAYSLTGSTLTISWPSNYLGWILQAQTNARTVGLRTNWFDVPGSASVTSTNLPVSPANPTVFYRLRYP